jgi:hypothetical protein
MTLVLELPPELEGRLELAAKEHDTDVAEYARQVLSEHLPPSSGTVDPTIALLDQWLEEDATDDPEELRRAEAELAEFKAAMNANRAAVGAPPVYP